MEKTIIAFESTQDAVIAINWCANFIVAGRVLTQAKIPFTLVSE